MITATPQSIHDYDEIYLLNQNIEKPILLVRHQTTGKLYVKKQVPNHLFPVLQALTDAQNHGATGFPRIYAIEEGEPLTIVEDYIHGQTLSRLLKTQCFSVTEAVNILCQLCDILIPLHKASPPIIHRDIKPENIIITDDGFVKLIDFDAARLYDPSVNDDTTHLGTTGFASPEQYGFNQSDSRSDIYALGILLNVMITGHHPKEGLAEEPFGKIVRCCTQMDPKKRYENVQSLKKALLKADRSEIKEQNIRNKTARFPDFYKKWAPPGFRTLTLWKMLVGILGYGMIIYLFYDVWKNIPSIPGWIATVLASFWVVFFLFDYHGVQQYFPACRHSNRWIRVLSIAIWIIIFSGCVILVGAIFTPAK